MFEKHIENLQAELDHGINGWERKAALRLAISALKKQERYETLAAEVKKLTEALSLMRAAGAKVSPRVAMAHANVRDALAELKDE